MEERNRFEALSADGRNIKINFKDRIQDMGWILLFQDEYQWRLLVNTVMKLHVP